VSPVRYELEFYIPEDDILHSHSRENIKSYIALTGWDLQRRRNVSPVRYELGFYIPEDGILHSHRRENLKSYIVSDYHRQPNLSSAVLLHSNNQQLTHSCTLRNMPDHPLRSSRMSAPQHAIRVDWGGFAGRGGVRSA
jgi:hypothetical protein